MGLIFIISFLIIKPIRLDPTQIIFICAYTSKNWFCLRSLYLQLIVTSYNIWGYLSQRSSGLLHRPQTQKAGRTAAK